MIQKKSRRVSVMDFEDIASEIHRIITGRKKNRHELTGLKRLRIAIVKQADEVLLLPTKSILKICKQGILDKIDLIFLKCFSATRHYQAV
jgi:hypothetical protein